jgi:hypothetical protein
MSIDEVEVLGGCQFYEESDPQKTKAKIIKNIGKNNPEENNVAIDDNRKALGSGPGFTGDELLSKDELNLIMDLEDE